MLISDKKEENAVEKNLTTGSVFKNVILFSLPYLLSYFLQTLYGMALLLMLVHPIVSVMSTPAEAVNGTAIYLTICFIGIPFITAYNIISAIFRGMGDSKSSMYFIAVACIANIVFDYVFMGALKLGPAGAALGTTISQAISVLVSVIVIIKRKSVVLSKKDFKPYREVMGKILYIGIPIAVQDGLIQVAFIVITIIANQRGLNDAAAVGIVEKIISFLFLVPSSMLSTVSALGAQNIGANKPERAIATLRYAVLIAVVFGILATITIQFTAGLIVALFTDRNTSAGADVIRLGSQYLRGYILTAFLQVFILASAVISVLVENPDYHSYITFWQLYWFVFREFI